MQWPHLICAVESATAAESVSACEATELHRGSFPPIAILHSRIQLVAPYRIHKLVSGRNAKQQVSEANIVVLTH